MKRLANFRIAKKLGTVLVIALIAGTAVWFLTGGSRGPMGSSVRKAIENREAFSTVSKWMGARDSRIEAMAEGRLHVTPSDFDAFLQQTGKTANGWVVAYLATSDLSMLKEIAKFPNDPTACLILAQDSGSGPEKLGWAMKLAKLQPENGMSHIAMADALRGMGRNEEAAVEWQRALESKTFDGLGTQPATCMAQYRDLLPNNAKLRLVKVDTDDRFLSGAMGSIISNSLAFKDVPESPDGSGSRSIVKQFQDGMALLNNIKSGSGFANFSDPEEVEYAYQGYRFHLLNVTKKAAAGTPEQVQVEQIKKAAVADLNPDGSLTKPARLKRWDLLSPQEVNTEINASLDRIH